MVSTTMPHPNYTSRAEYTAPSTHTPRGRGRQGYAPVSLGEGAMPRPLEGVESGHPSQDSPSDSEKAHPSGSFAPYVHPSVKAEGYNTHTRARMRSSAAKTHRVPTRPRPSRLRPSTPAMWREREDSEYRAPGTRATTRRPKKRTRPTRRPDAEPPRRPTQVQTGTAADYLKMATQVATQSTYEPHAGVSMYSVHPPTSLAPTEASPHVPPRPPLSALGVPPPPHAKRVPTSARVTVVSQVDL
ncbi:hypothetical protein KIPB_004746 [Kipferlia bialata]|uniref:Uncharacterized protein n=1 Tax=Kipferlia bialata TaxID=797122 RepID=A0A9K3GHP0_9EUKA|nr:hypothetical protein KIPB_004746 [Kipferlia bialata]|eukprot:g4746.t1